jgi:hypothetical protein
VLHKSQPQRPLANIFPGQQISRCSEAANPPANPVPPGHLRGLSGQQFRQRQFIGPDAWL